LKISDIFKTIYNKCPQLKGVDFALTNRGKVLDKKKTIGDYKIDSQNSTIIATVPDYLLSSKGIVKLMKISGYWQYDEKIINDLGLNEDFKKYELVYGVNKKDHSMTKSLKEYL
jgi:hypothetical protein